MTDDSPRTTETRPQRPWHRRRVVLGAVTIGLSVPLLLALCTVPNPVNPPEPAPTPTPAATTTATTAPATTPEQFGAVGDGVTDDSVALQRAFDSVAEGGAVELPAGKTYAHAQVLTLTRPEMQVTGGGTLLATQEATSEVWVRGDGISLTGITLAITGTTKRWDAYEQMKLRIGSTDGVSVTDVTIDGSAAAGIFVGGATNFEIARVTVRNTRADAIQVTEGSADGTITAPTVTGSGDDGVSVVSYSDYPICARITVTEPRVTAQQWGRAFAVVGGQDITFNDVYAESSSAAGVYISSEPNYNTLPVTRVTVAGGTLVTSNQNATVDHGAVLLYNGQSGTVDSDITISDLEIVDTRPSASRNVGIINGPDASHERVTLERFTITGGPATPFYTNAPSDSYSLTGWVVDSQPWGF